MEDSTGTSEVLLIDEIYEFSAPRFFDFVNGETEDDARVAELWFDTNLSYAPSPFMLRVKAGRSVQLGTQCEFGDDQQTIKAPGSLDPTTEPSVSEGLSLKLEESIASTEIKENTNPNKSSEKTTKVVPTDQVSVSKRSNKSSCGQISKKDGITVKAQDTDGSKESATRSLLEDVCTPKPPSVTENRVQVATVSNRQKTAKKIASALKNPSALKSKIQSHLTHSKSIKPASVRRDASTMKNSAGTPNLVQENQAIKRQKLADGKTRQTVKQILNIKPPSLPHKTRLGVAANASKLSSSTVMTSKENRKMYVREPAAPYVSMAAMVNKFQSSTRDMTLPQNGKSRLTLTRPKEPEFVTSQRVRLVKLKSSAELEEEMMAKMPKFKARPLNKKIFETSSLPPLPKSLPPKPEFQEFHLETMERANKNSDASSVVSTEAGHQKTQSKSNHLTEPKTPVLQTSLRARPTNVKTSLEIEQEELEKIPKFKARPLNKKIFESKGELGLFCNTKKQVTVPKEFHFAIDERIPPPPPSHVVDLFDKLSINSEPSHEKQVPRLTKPNPFNLYTEERGAEKERRLITELMQKQLEEERARVPRAKPYPYTTDFPVVPPKPEPKECTRPQPFELESLIRHEEELRREMEETQRKERELAQLRIFKAQPVLKEDPIPLPEKERKPLTQVQEFNLQVEHRAVDRAEFDKKIKEKEIKYKRYREEAEAEKQMEEEKALKQLRRTLVPHARPVPQFANPFMPQKSFKEPTKAKSPKLRVLRRKERKVLPPGNNLQSAFSTAAGLMR